MLLSWNEAYSYSWTVELIQEPPAILATVPDKRPSRKKAKAGKDQKREADNDPPLLDAQTEGLLSGIFVGPVSCVCFPYIFIEIL